MKYDIESLKKTIEDSTDYSFEIVEVLNIPTLRLITNSDRYEVYIELNKSYKTINPYLSLVIHDLKTADILRNNEIFNIKKIVTYLQRTILDLKIDYIPKTKKNIQLQMNL